MGFLNDLFEYEKAITPGERLGSYLRYHKTKAGLYVVLKHDTDGSLYIPDEKLFSSKPVVTTVDTIPLPEGFIFKELSYEKSIDQQTLIRSFSHHESGVRVEHDTDKHGKITALDFRFFYGNGPPLWCFGIGKSGEEPEVSGAINFRKGCVFGSDGKIKGYQDMIKLEGKTIDYPESLFMMLVSMYHNNHHDLTSLGFLTFKDEPSSESLADELPESQKQ